MSEHATPTHEVLRPGISLGGGKQLVPGDQVDTTDWLPRLTNLWERRGVIRQIANSQLTVTVVAPAAVSVPEPVAAIAQEPASAPAPDSAESQSELPAVAGPPESTPQETRTAPRRHRDA